MKKRVFSGIQPAGRLHIGNYFGAIRQWVAMQKDSDCFYCVVDLHAFTVPQKPLELSTAIRETTGLLLAAGIDPALSTLFVQSDVSAHAELAWILDCITPVGWLRRMTQFKDKAEEEKENASTGLFNYPVLMASDILLYETDLVPVGEDQVQHLELTRDIAQRFNSLYGQTFKLPESRLPDAGARVMGLDDPAKKMSKSDEHPGHAIYLLDTPDEIRGKIARATTDSLREVRFDDSRPGITNLLGIYELFTQLPRPQIEARFEGKGYMDFKKELADVIVNGLQPLQSRYRELAEDPVYIESVLAEGASRAQPVAAKMLDEVKRRIGMGYNTPENVDAEALADTE